MCHLLLELGKLSAAFLAHTLFLISDGILQKKEVNSTSGFNTRFLCSWSWSCYVTRFLSERQDKMKMLLCEKQRKEFLV